MELFHGVLLIIDYSPMQGIWQAQEFSGAWETLNLFRIAPPDAPGRT